MMTLHTLSVLCMKMCIYSNIHVLSICDVILLICLQACYAALQGLRQLCKHCLKKDACYVQLHERTPQMCTYSYPDLAD